VNQSPSLYGSRGADCAASARLPDRGHRCDSCADQRLPPAESEWAPAHSSVRGARFRYTKRSDFSGLFAARALGLRTLVGAVIPTIFPVRRALPCARGLATVIPNLSGSNNLSRWSHGSSKRRLFVVPQRSRRTSKICTRSWPLSNYKTGLGAPGASTTEYHPQAHGETCTNRKDARKLSYFLLRDDADGSHFLRFRAIRIR
jgi:hypothetical protein